VTPVRKEYVPRRSPTRPGPHSGVSTAQFTQSIQPCAKLATTVRKSKRMSSATISTIVRNRPALWAPTEPIPLVTVVSAAAPMATPDRFRSSRRDSIRPPLRAGSSSHPPTGEWGLVRA
jgi:hypothetical protein